MIDIKLLKTIQAVADTGSLQGAATRLFVTQSALSHQLRDIEQRLGTPLFVRKSQPLQFSWQGQLLLDLAGEVLPQMNRVEAQLLAKQPQHSQLRLTVECHACFHWLLPALKAFRAEHPDVDLQLVTDIDHHAVEAMVQGELELVLTTDQRLDAQVRYQPVFELELLAYMAPEHPLAAKTYLQPDDLIQQRLLTYPIEPERQDLFRFFLDKHRFEGSQRHVAQASQMLQLVAAGEGIAVLPTWLQEPFVSQGLIVTKPLGANGLKRTMYLATPRHLQLAVLADFYPLLRQLAPR